MRNTKLRKRLNDAFGRGMALNGRIYIHLGTFQNDRINLENDWRMIGNDFRQAEQKVASDKKSK